MTKFENNWEAEPQIESNRKGMDTLVYENTLVSLEDFGLYEFAYLTTDDFGNIAGYNFTLERITLFESKNYNDINLLTDGIGRGPREMKLVRDLQFDENENLWAIDLDGGKVTLWSKDDELIKSFNPNKKHARPYRIALCNSFLTILSEQYLGEGLYHNFDLSGKAMNSFMVLSNKNMDEFKLWSNATYFRGDLTCNDDKVYHVGKFKNYIKKYDQNGNLIFSKKVIEFEGNHEPLLKVEKRSSSRKGEVKTISGQIEVVNDYLWISFSGKRNSYFYILDVYDLEGNYKTSYQFKHPTKEFTTAGKYVYTLETHRDDKKQYISKYKLPIID